MSNYLFSLHNYHAIKSAKIALDGITILTGENGCGKSTLSRWLYYIINGVANFEESLIKSFVLETLFIINRWDIVTRDILRNLNNGTTHQGHQFTFISQAQDQLQHLISFEEVGKDSINRTEHIFLQTLDAFAEQILAFLKTNVPSVRKERVLKFLNLKIEKDFSVIQIITQFKDTHKRLIEKKTNDIYTRLQERKINDFYKFVVNEYGEEDTPPTEIQFTEDGVDIFEDSHISSIYNLNRAIYIDTPMALTIGAGNEFWRELDAMMYIPPIKGNSKEVLSLIQRIKKLIGGEAKIIDDNVFADMQELRFVSEDGLIDIELAKAATGIKTFTYIQRLLEGGLLNKNTLLLIDEPEVHLHPQWIVEYARLLVLINKKIGTKIIIASHNPDMVAAIRAISEKENTIDQIRFYLAKSDGKHQYTFKDLHGEIGEIFNSFNIALDRIKMYGTDCI